MEAKNPADFHSGSRSELRAQWIHAALLIVISASWSIQYPFWPYRTKLVDQGKIVDYSSLAFALFVGGIAIWLWSMSQLLRQFRGRSFHQQRLVVGITTIMLLGSFVVMYPTNAIDVFIYAARSRLLTHYGENPNAVQPALHWDVDPYMKFASKEWADNLSPYGPLWNQLAAPVTWIVGDSIAAAVIGFKLLSVAATIGIAWLIYDIVKTRRPEWALVATLFWLWNPLVLWDGIGNAHNDVILMLPVVGALWAWQRRQDNWVIPLLFASVLIKYVTIILIPIAVVAIWRRNRTSHARLEGILWSMASVLLLLGISLYPFYDLDSIWTSAREQGARVSNSLTWVVMASAIEWDVGTISADTIRNIGYTVVAIAIAYWMIVCWRQPDQFYRASFEAMFMFMLIASTNQRAWYVIWLIPLAAVMIPETPWRRALLWSITSMLGYACTIWLWSVWDFDAWGYYWYLMIVVTVVFLPVLALTAWEAIGPGQSQRNGGRRSAVG